MGLLAGILATRLGLGGGLATLAAWAIVAVLATGAGLGVYKLVKHWGGQEVLQKIERQNNEAGNAGTEARTTLDDCLARGGVYHFDTGKCARP